MCKANVLVQYQGGGYSGCHWEWNFFLTNDMENPTEFEDIFSSGCDGIDSIEKISELKDRQYRKDVYEYDLTKEEDWEEFDREANPSHVLGITKWLVENRLELVHFPRCDKCGCDLIPEEVVLAGYHGQGGLVIAPGQKTCEECDQKETWDEWVKPEILSDLEREGITFGNLPDEDIETILGHAMCNTNTFWEGSGDDCYLHGIEELVEFIVVNKDNIARDALCEDKQLELV